MWDHDNTIKCEVVKEHRDKYILHVTSASGDGTSFALDYVRFKELFKSVILIKLQNEIDDFEIKKINKLKLVKQITDINIS